MRLSKILIASILCLVFVPVTGFAQLPDKYIVAVVNEFYNPLAVSTSIAAGQFFNSLGSTDSDDGVASNIPVGFSFDYFGKKYNSVNVCVNGWISVGIQSVPAKTSDKRSLFALSSPGNVIAPYWGDHTIGKATKISYQTISVPDPNPNATFGAFLHTFIVEWRSLIINSKTDSNSIASFQVKLVESSLANDLTHPDSRVSIEYQYGNYGGLKTQLNGNVGIKDSADSVHLNALFSTAEFNGDSTRSSTSSSTTWPPIKTSGNAVTGSVIQLIPPQSARDTQAVLFSSPNVIDTLSGDLASYRAHRIDFVNNSSDSLTIINAALTTSNNRFWISQLLPGDQSGVHYNIPPGVKFSMIVNFTGDTKGTIYKDTIVLTTSHAITSSYIYINGNSVDTTNTGVSQNSNTAPDNFRIYPNPTKGDIAINLPSDFGTPSRVVLFDEHGGEFGNLKYSFDGEKLLMQIPNRADGIYFIRVEGKNVAQAYKFTLLR